MVKPEMVEVPAFEVWTHLPLGVTAFQQVAASRVGTLVLIGVRVPFEATE
jgi:hypothetical protein